MANRSLLLALGAAVTATTHIVSAQRASVDISYGWRFSLGHFQCSDYPISLNDQQVFGLSETQNVTDAAGCRAAACAQAAEVYQWCVGGAPCGEVASCWLGAWPGSSNPQAGWVSGRVNNSAPVTTPPEAYPAFPDDAWTVLDLPHDFEVAGTYAQNDNQGEGYLPYNTSFYRKHLAIPAAWAGTRVELYVEGALSASQWWLNGAPLAGGRTFTSGYTALIMRLDDIPGVVFGGPNVLVGFIDGTRKTGWWYEGAGLYRRVRITSANLGGSIVTHGVAAPADVTGAVTPHQPGSSAAGLHAPAAVRPSVALRNDGTAAAVLTVTFTLRDASGVAVATGTTPPLTVPSGGANVTAALASPLALTSAELWSVGRPYLYILTSAVSNGAGTLVDSTNVTIGVRATLFDADAGFHLNGEYVKMRGFCNHENFGAIGAAVPPRVDLLRLQQMRGVGGNAWRTSHNAPEPHLLDLTDRLGVLVLDENRVFSTTANCPGCGSVPSYAGDPVQDFADLVSRDKLHASVAFYSFCNEMGCGDGKDQPSHDFRIAAYEQDGSRPVAANMIGWVTVNPTAMSRNLDVMGFSHSNADNIANFHKQEPAQPVVASECCSCESQRGEDPDQPHDATVFQFDEIQDCLLSETQRFNAQVFLTGQFIWTLHDYIGEPDKWPHVSSSFGSFDVGAFPKAASFWMRAWWLSNINATTDAGRPPLGAAGVTTAYLVESWAPNGHGGPNRTLHAYTNAPFVRLSVNGVPVGADVAMPTFGVVTWRNVTYAAGSATVSALATRGGAPLASHTRFSWGAPAAVVLSVDAPSPTTGTGRAVYLDGTDVALLRATVVDAAGVTVANSVANITFTVTAGPGLLLGTVNGDPACHVANGAAWKPAYHGLVRAIVRANLVAVGTDRAQLAAVNTDAGVGPLAAPILPAGSAPPTSMTITATAPGLSPASITVMLSTDPADEALAVAAASVGVAAITE